MHWKDQPRSRLSTRNYSEVPQLGAGVPMIMHSEIPWISSFFETSDASN